MSKAETVWKIQMPCYDPICKPKLCITCPELDKESIRDDKNV